LYFKTSPLAKRLGNSAPRAKGYGAAYRGSMAALQLSRVSARFSPPGAPSWRRPQLAEI
jgi:hypothetical protein